MIRILLPILSECIRAFLNTVVIALYFYRHSSLAMHGKKIGNRKFDRYLETNGRTTCIIYLSLSAIVFCFNQSKLAENDLLSGIGPCDR